jgi:hypothetical protein
MSKVFSPNDPQSHQLYDDDASVHLPCSLSTTNWNLRRCNTMGCEADLLTVGRWKFRFCFGWPR